MREVKPIIAILSLCLVTCGTVISQNRRVFPNVPTVNYCDLVREAEKFDKQVIRVRAVYYVGFEGSLFSVKDCEDKDTWVAFDPSFEQTTNRKILKQFRRLADASPVKNRGGGITHPVKSVEILAVGKFDGMRQSQTFEIKERKLTLSAGYGHLNAFDYQFTVLAIEEVKPQVEPQAEND